MGGAGSVLMGGAGSVLRGGGGERSEDRGRGPL